MPTEQQIQANRRNAQRSTGPRTPAGKYRSSKNAIKHGFYAREVLIPQEEGEDFDEFAQAMRDDLQPCGALEEVLATQVVVSAWRLKRLTRIESGVFADFLSKAQREWARVGTGVVTPNGAHLPDIPAVVPWGRAFTYFNENGELLERLTRYQSLVTREFYRALRELQRMQAANPANILPEQNEPISPEPSVLSVSSVPYVPCLPSAAQNEPISASKAPCPAGGKGLGGGSARKRRVRDYSHS
ncbi:MAG TPA: hypothetical protein VGM23_12985 [Armatimonadota bacterium]|jgi:hypothetical protein